MVEVTPSAEQEIAQLEQQLAQKRAGLEQGPGPESLPSEKELLRQTIGERLQNITSPSPQPQPQPQPAAPVPPPGDDQPSYTRPELKGQVQQLVDMAFTKSLEEAIKEAAKSNNAALIDAFHDVIVDEIYAQLLERKKIQPLPE